MAMHDHAYLPRHEGFTAEASLTACVNKFAPMIS